MSHRRLLAIVVLVFPLGACDEFERQKGSRTIRQVSERVLWESVQSGDSPRYPEGGGSGTAVVALLIGDDGRVLATRMLESPGAAASQVVEHTIATWRFAVIAPPGGLAEGSLTFYFEISDGHGRVVKAVDKAKARAGSAF